jgi:hypothetical protein
MKNNDIIKGLNAFCEENCNITIVSSETIANEDADFVRFSFDGNECIAIVWHDGTIYTPSDWQNDYTEFKQSDIPSVDWMDADFRPCVIFNGMPRML